MRHGFRVAIKLCLALAVPLAAGCAAPVYTTYDSNSIRDFIHGAPFQAVGFSIDSIGVCGPMSSDVADLFIYDEYLAADLGPDCASALDKAGTEGIKFVAAVEKAPDDPKSLRVEQDYTILVLDMRTGDVIWRVDGEEGPRGARIRRNATLELAFHDMVKAFARTYPPASKRVAPQAREFGS